MTDSPLEKKPAPLAKQPPEAPKPVVGTDTAPVRASDADRDRVADILREALAQGRLDAEEHGERVEAVYAAKTVAELRPLVRDLPEGLGAGQEPEPEPELGTEPEAQRSGRWAEHLGHGHGAGHGAGHGEKDDIVAIFSGASRQGRWSVPAKINAFACFGGIEIDLTEATFAHARVEIAATAIFGGIDIRVPENVTLRQKGAGIFGGFDVHTVESPEPGAPVVVVKGAAVFGGVGAKPKKGKRVRDLRDRFRKEP